MEFFFGKKCQVFGNFLTVKWQFSGGSIINCVLYLELVEYFLRHLSVSGGCVQVLGQCQRQVGDFLCLHGHIVVFLLWGQASRVFSIDVVDGVETAVVESRQETSLVIVII